MKQANNGFLPKLNICGDFIVKSGWVLETRINPEYEIVYFPSGTQSLYTTTDCEYKLDRPCFIFTRPNENHRYHFKADSPIRHLFIHFQIEADDRHAFLNEISAFTLDDHPILSALFKYVIYLASSRPAQWHERCGSLIFFILQELATIRQNTQVRPKLSPQISAAIEQINTKYNHPLSIKEISESSGWGHEYFTRKFVEQTGMSPKHMLINRRIEAACEILQMDTLSVKEVAFQVGFNDEHYFSKAFHKIKGIHPSEFRKKYSYQGIRQFHIVPSYHLNELYPVNKYFTVE